MLTDTPFLISPLYLFVQIADMAKSSAMAVDHINRNILSIKNSVAQMTSVKRLSVLNKMVEVMKNVCMVVVAVVVVAFCSFCFLSFLGIYSSNVIKHLDADEIGFSVLSDDETDQIATTINDTNSRKLDSVPLTISLKDSFASEDISSDVPLDVLFELMFAECSVFWHLFPCL